VYVTPSETVTDTSPDGDRQGVTEALLRAYEDQIEFLRKELERKDTIIMTMAQRIPELEPAKEPSPEPRESPETASKGEEGVEVPIKEERHSWLYRFFFGP
jgi:hypothetical protein